MSSTNSSAPGEQHGLQDWILESVQHYQSYQLAACTALTSFALLLFEYVTTFDREIRYLSDGKRTWAKAVFILNRYISLLQSTATLFCALSSPSFIVVASSSRVSSKQVQYFYVPSGQSSLL
ncbi:hypothetical protein BD309DRAFT_228075 [Dichomitus squalens]|nr:hypothetical protein BD309DRAFT_228075 [Dichomitus squalens]